MRNLVLVGFMGSGKTMVGQRVAARLGLKFVDMDRVIEERAGRKISDIFATDGEAHFRQLERKLVQELAGQQNQVIATGGGVVLNPENLRDFGGTGVVICLWCEPDVLHRRTQHARHRPLLEETDRRQRLEELLRQRAPLYLAIPHRVDNTHNTVEQDVESVLRIYRDQTTRPGAGV
jgi:shikimate kinase